MPSKQIQIGHLNFQVLEEGNGLPVLLLHGFPDSSYLWRHQIPALTQEGMQSSLQIYVGLVSLTSQQS